MKKYLVMETDPYNETEDIYPLNPENFDSNGEVKEEVILRILEEDYRPDPVRDDMKDLWGTEKVIKENGTYCIHWIWDSPRLKLVER